MKLNDNYNDNYNNHLVKRSLIEITITGAPVQFILPQEAC